eukprot:m.178812 g.178812  ORF g.178812 m.178812 type:complete len:524 (+) comp16842_c0_seq22:2832-4403(+)
MLLPTDVCDNERDCNNGWDERGDCRVYLQFEDTSVLSECQRRNFNVEVRSGVGHVATRDCYSHHFVLRSNRSIEGHTGGETYRIFIADNGCGYALFRFKHPNGSGWYHVSRAVIGGGIIKPDIDVSSINCPLWSVETFRQVYSEYHTSSATVEPTAPRAPSSRSSKLSTAAVVVLTIIGGALLSVVVVLLYKSRKASSRVNEALERLLKQARFELDELYGQSPSQQAMAILSKSDVTFERRIGEGHFGHVWQGSVVNSTKALHDNRDVAVKLLTAGSDEGLVQAALMEAILHHRLQHANIVACLGVVYDVDMFGLVLELCALGNARDYLRSNTGAVSSHTKQLWLYQVAGAVSYLHEQQVVHRDLALRNVLIKSPEHVMLADFGLSRFVALTTSYYSTNAELELPFRWSAPESLIRSRFSQESDIWSFGVVCVEVYSNGATPYGDEGYQQVLQRHRDHNCGLLQGLVAVPAAMQRLIAHCLNYTISARPKAASIVQTLRHGPGPSLSLDSQLEHDDDMEETHI